MPRPLRNPDGEAKILAPVRPNVGLEIAYRKRLEALVEQMHRSLLWFLRAAYRANPPVLAQDSPASDMAAAMRILARRWLSRFDKAADELARYFSLAMAKRSDAALKAILKRAGIAVEFRMSPAMRDVLHATIHQQVGLIKSIGQEHLSAVQGSVMRAVQGGHDLHALTLELQHRYDLSLNRAALIAKDQNNKATASMTRARQTELGIEKAIWLHSHGGNEPRPTHLANSGEPYIVSEGWFDPDPKVRKRIWPGELIRAERTPRFMALGGACCLSAAGAAQPSGRASAARPLRAVLCARAGRAGDAGPRAASGAAAPRRVRAAADVPWRPDHVRSALSPHGAATLCRGRRHRRQRDRLPRSRLAA
jgi:hypothetical protein